MYAKSAETREKILKGAKQVILKKGYASTTMKDITEECGMSRGGLYFHFSSVEEIFIAVLKNRKRSSKTMVQKFIKESGSFAQLLDRYFEHQVRRIMHMEDSLLSAMIEFGVADDNYQRRQLIEEQYSNTQEILIEMLESGIKAPKKRLEALSCQMMFLIEGMSIKAMTANMEEEAVADQFSLLKKQLLEEEEAYK